MDRTQPTHELVECPRCQGRGRVFEPHSQKLDPLCGMCAGRGRVKNKTCQCGRPVVWEIEDMELCNALECWTNVQKVLENRAKTAGAVSA